MSTNSKWSPSPSFGTRPRLTLARTSHAHPAARARSARSAKRVSFSLQRPRPGRATRRASCRQLTRARAPTVSPSPPSSPSPPIMNYEIGRRAGKPRIHRPTALAGSE
eukprot:scaffold5917_cov31-Tisochrysis_lutea.AAC.2